MGLGCGSPQIWRFEEDEPFEVIRISAAEIDASSISDNAEKPGCELNCTSNSFAPSGAEGLLYELKPVLVAVFQSHIERYTLLRSCHVNTSLCPLFVATATVITLLTLRLHVSMSRTLCCDRVH